MRTLSTTQITRDRIVGQAAPNARIVLKNLSLAPYAPDSPALQIVARADASGRFVIEGPQLRSGDLVRLEAGSKQLDVRLPGKLRRPEAEVQGLRLRCKDGVGTFENILSRDRIADPGVQLRFTNARTGKTIEVALDADGALPKGTKLAARAGDQIDIHVAPSSGSFPAKKWASLVAQTTKRSLDPPQANGSNVTGTTLLSSLYIGGIEASDPAQGDVGDCWILSTLSAIAHTAPDRIARIIREDEASGTAAVTFHRWDRKQRGFRTDEVNVTPEFFSNDEGLVYGRSTDAKESWVSVIEKAYAQWKGGYEATAVGYPYAAFEALLGVRGEQIFLNIEDDATCFEKLRDAVSRPTVAVSNAGPKREMKDAGLVEDHAYTVLDAYEKGGERYVRLRNPWGQFEPTRNGKDDGDFEMTFTDFKLRFAYACQA